MKHILITGDKGYIGSKLAKAFPGYEGMDLKAGIDILDTKKFPEADIVYHLAAQTDVQKSIEDPELDALWNILATIKIIEQYKNSKIIFVASAASVDIQSPYGLSKKTCEEYIKLRHDNYVILRLPNVFGDGGSGIVDILERGGDITINGDGYQTRDYIYVGDVVDALLLAEGAECGEYSISSNRSISVKDLVKASGRDVEYGEPKPGEIRHSRLTTTLPGWKPRVDVLDYLREKCQK